MTDLLEVANLHVKYGTRAGPSSQALAGVSFALQRGETLGVLGESGSGKSTLAAALLRLLPANGEIEHGSIRFEGCDLLQFKLSKMESIRGGRIALIFQEPSLALHPAIRVGQQIANVVAAHQAVQGREASERAQQVLAAVFPTETRRIADSYPHQLSGGQRARVLIAQAISCQPSLIVTDEPTASLDPETQLEILSLFRRLRRELRLSLIWITHNPALLMDFADRVMILYAGRVVEVGSTESVLCSPRHPYTRALLRCLPPGWDEGLASHQAQLPVISGEAPTLDFSMRGCRFEPRCAERMDVCTSREPEMVRLSEAHHVSCFKHSG